MHFNWFRGCKGKDFYPTIYNGTIRKSTCQPMLPTQADMSITLLPSGFTSEPRAAAMRNAEMTTTKTMPKI